MKNLKTALKNGETILGTFSVSSSPSMVEMIGYAGWDFVILDCEHAATSPFGTELEGLIRAACAADITPLVRVTENDPGMILKALNFGAKGVIVPHVNTKADVERLVKAAHYAPEGRRSSAPPVRAAKHGFIEWSTFWREANRDTLVIPLMEEEESIRNIDEILSVDGIDVLFYGPFDLSMTLGLDGVSHLPEIEERLTKVVSACRKKDIPVANLSWDIQSSRRWMEMGCRMIVLGVDLVFVRQTYQEVLKQAKGVLGVPR